MSEIDDEHSSESAGVSETGEKDRRRLSRLNDRRLSDDVDNGRVGLVEAEGGMNIYSMAPGEPPKIAEVFARFGVAWTPVPVIGLYRSLKKRMKIYQLECGQKTL